MNIFFRIKRRIHWEWLRFADWVYRNLVKPPYVMSFEETINYILTHHASVSRFGDGELGVIYGVNLEFQKSNACLAQKLHAVLKSNVEYLLICVPDAFQKVERYNEVEQGFWKASMLFNRRRWYVNLKADRNYGNAFISRFYGMEFNKELSAHRLELLKKLWEGRDVIFVEGKDTKMGVGNDLFDNVGSIRRILCPSENAFSKYDEIIEKVNGIARNKNNLFILALGPTATVMAADLHQLNLQALDLGHMDIEYEWYKMGVTKKVPVTGKYSNEAVILGLAESTVTGKLNDAGYQQQIIIDLSE